ncbi:S8 family serine peptidase [Pseudomonas fakonensis]|uniref:S8 family serine peptidase n=1 Tax=Pseudomonas fakonensis TaxID=2842355 RepID=A0ABX8MYD6_9PSED|nr:S8 family serine peptidase [Pseudomonas fakonensis]QXH49268.1 S8 family serine peptidase [Pseudomonas fakonensis]
MFPDLSFVYYRNFRFDGKFHVRCTGPDLHKVARIRYQLERQGPGDPVLLQGLSALGHASSGKLADHGCPVSFVTREVAGRYAIRPKVVLLDEYAIALGRPTGAAGVFDFEPLLLQVGEDELDRSVLDKVPLPAGLRNRRAVPDEGQGLDDPYGRLLAPFPAVPVGERYPVLQIGFSEGGYQCLLDDLEPGSGSVLLRLWPSLGQVLELRPLLAANEHEDTGLGVLGRYCMLEQPAGMSNATFVELIKTLAALEYVQSLQFIGPSAEPNLLLLGAAGLLAALLTGAAVHAGDSAEENARPTPDFEALQTYLDAPGSKSQGLNIRVAWQQQVTGKGGRIHFTDGGLFPNHEDLHGNPNLIVVNETPNDDPRHGTASTGIMLAVKNGRGMTGISHDSELFLYDNRAKDSLGGSQVLKDLLHQVLPGDIVGINRQTANPQVLGTFLPAVHDRAWWDVIRQLSQRGAVVVVAAANGAAQGDSGKGTVQNQGVDLAQWPYFSDHGDADAILVGACHSWDGKPHQYSNYNYRYRMLNAWGDSVATLSYGALQDKTGDDRDYTGTYGGTSSATPLVTGALSLVQSYAMTQHHVYLDANQMHLLIMASGYDDATLPLTDVLPMGARPNVQGALALLDRLLGGGRFDRG